MKHIMIDFEEIYTDQTWYQNDPDRFCSGGTLPAGGINGYCSAESYDALREYCAQIEPPTLAFLGSGNYHYLSYFLMEQIKCPFSLVLFDYHSDMQLGRNAELLSCGNWVHFALRNYPNLRQVFVLGVSEQYVPKRYHTYGKEVFFFCEEQVKRPGFRGKLAGLIHFPVYLSVDKDVCSEQLVHTNWDQGSMELQSIRALFEMITATCVVVGGDICGECTKDYADSNYRTHQLCNGRLNQFLMDCFQLCRAGTAGVHPSEYGALRGKQIV